MANVRTNQLGTEVIGPFLGGHVRANQSGVEEIGVYSPIGNHIRTNQLGLEVIGAPPPSLMHVRAAQMGIEVVGPPSSPPFAGDTLGAELYIGPGVNRRKHGVAQPFDFHPLWDPIESFPFSEALKGVGVVAVAGTASSVQLDGATTTTVTFVTPFASACLYVGCTYVPATGDTNPIVVKDLVTNVTKNGFTLVGYVIAGTAGGPNGTFNYGAIGV